MASRFCPKAVGGTRSRRRSLACSVKASAGASYRLTAPPLRPTEKSRQDAGLPGSLSQRRTGRLPPSPALAVPTSSRPATWASLKGAGLRSRIHRRLDRQNRRLSEPHLGGIPVRRWLAHRSILSRLGASDPPGAVHCIGRMILPGTRHLLQRGRAWESARGAALLIVAMIVTAPVACRAAPDDPDPDACAMAGTSEVGALITTRGDVEIRGEVGHPVPGESTCTWSAVRTGLTDDAPPDGRLALASITWRTRPATPLVRHCYNQDGGALRCLSSLKWIAP